MAESKANWDQVGEDFKVLGRQVKQHYEQRPRAEAGASKEGAADQTAPSADRRKVDDALQKLVDSLEQALAARPTGRNPLCAGGLRCRGYIYAIAG